MALEITHEEYSHIFNGFVDGVKVSYLELWEDCETNEYWLNGIYVLEKENRGKGYASSLFKKALEHYPEILISTATAYDHKTRGDMTSRELTDEGRALVYNLIKKNILKSEWLKNPFGSCWDGE